MTFTVAIVGRPNVGKSTLFNRLTGKRQALVDDMPGVTRDRRLGAATLGPLEFSVVDTAGWEEAEDGSLQARMTAQTEEAVADADVTLFVIDARAGVTHMDKHFADWLRKKKKPVIVLANKSESGKSAAALGEAYSLGLGEPIPISAEHAEGMLEVYEALAQYESPVTSHESLETSDSRPETPLQLAIVGRPNVGKSTLINRILGKERVLTGPEAGITRDAIMIDYDFEGTPIKLVDTAGMRRKFNVTGKIEKLAVADTLTAIQYAHVVAVVVDAADSFLDKQDNTIAALIEQEGRAMVIAVNKWDTIKDKVAWMKAFEQRLEKVLPQVKGIPVIPISAKTGDGIPKLMKACLRTYGLWNKEIGTGELNRWLEASLEVHTPPLIKGRRIKIRYMTQKTARPPTFLLFSNTSDIPESYLRYLVHGLRDSFHLPGVPIRLKIRKSKNPYAENP